MAFLTKGIRIILRDKREEEEKILLKAIEQIQSVVKNEKLDFE